MSPKIAPWVPPLPICSVPSEMVVPPSWNRVPVTTRVPAPSLVTEPEPNSSPEKVEVSERLNARLASFSMIPPIVPDVPPPPICSVPPEISVRSMLLSAVRVRVLAFSLVSWPTPSMRWAKVTLSDRLKASSDSTKASPPIAPEVPPSPICSVPSITLVRPEKVLSAVSVRTSWLNLISWPDPEISPGKVMSLEWSN